MLWICSAFFFLFFSFGFSSFSFQVTIGNRKFNRRETTEKKMYLCSLVVWDIESLLCAFHTYFLLTTVTKAHTDRERARDRESRHKQTKLNLTGLLIYCRVLFYFLSIITSRYFTSFYVSLYRCVYVCLFVFWFQSNFFFPHQFTVHLW